MFDKEISQNDYAILAPKDEEGVTQEEDFDVTEEEVVEVTEDDKITEQLKKEIHESDYSHGSLTIK